MAQQVAFRQPGQYTDVEQRCPEAATGEGQAELAGARFIARQRFSLRYSRPSRVFLIAPANGLGCADARRDRSR